VIENAHAITGAVGENLRAALEWLPKGRELITVKTDCDLAGHVVSFEETLVGRPEDKQALVDFFQRYGFKTMLREVSSRTSNGAPSAAPLNSPEGAQATLPGMPVIRGEYETVLTEEQLDKWLALVDAAGLTSVDTETTSLDPMTAQMVGISLSVEAGKGCYIPMAHRYAGVPLQLPRELVLERLKPWLENPDKPKLGQNLKYDMHIFANHGVTLRGIVHDTLLESYVFESHKPHDMDTMALRHLGYTTIPYVDVCGKGANQICFDEVELARATEYAGEDSDITLRLHQSMLPHVESNEGLNYVYRNIELPTQVVLQKIERNGVLVDAGLLAVQSRELAERIARLEEQAYEAAGGPFNLGSPKQIGEIFFGKLGLPIIKKTATGAPSTDEEVLQKLAEDFPLPKILLEHRGLSKLKSTYTDKLPKMVNKDTGRVHTNYAQAVAVTGRLASNDPNLQNIPVRTSEGRRIREAFIASPGSVIVSADYSQIELRIMAHISGDEAMLRAFAQGEDIHRATAAEIFNVLPDEVQAEQRRYAKVINFGLIYGMSAFGLASNLGIERSAAQNYIERYFNRFSGVKQYMDETRLAAKQRGYVETVFGRRLWLPEINSPNGPRRAGAERAAINAPMQGTAADLIKLAMIAVQGWLENEKLATRMVMQVHDELVLEVPESELELVKAKLPALMAGVAKLNVPLLAETGVGPNWERAH
jgi:DNA polymerase-1